jgi:hypothetical protein
MWGYRFCGSQNNVRIRAFNQKVRVVIATLGGGVRRFKGLSPKEVHRFCPLGIQSLLH